MNTLDTYLNTILSPKKEKEPYYNPCCSNKRNIILSTNLLQGNKFSKSIKRI